MEKESSNLYLKLYRGDFSLAMTFWGFYVSTGILNLALIAIATNTFPAPTNPDGISPLLIPVILLPLMIFVERPFLSIALYNSAKKYQGNPIWQKLAIAVSALTIIIAVCLLLWVASDHARAYTLLWEVTALVRMI